MDKKNGPRPLARDPWAKENLDCLRCTNLFSYFQACRQVDDAFATLPVEDQVEHWRALALAAIEELRARRGDFALRTPCQGVEPSDDRLS